MKKYNKIKKYNYGTEIENPNQALVRNQLMMDKAKFDGANSVKGLKMLGNGLVQAGSMVSSFAEPNPEATGFKKFMQDNPDSINQAMTLMNMFAMGGQIPGVPVEVEGQEVAQMPNGQLSEFKGPSHEQGGIPIALPEGTEIYSKRIKIDGVSMANRKKKREKQSMTLESLLEKNKTDILLQNALKRTKQNNEYIENADNQIQDVVKKSLDFQENNNQGVEKFDDGGKIIDKLLSHSGDIIGLAGNLFNMNAGMDNTMANRAGDTPNINAFKDYGKEGLETIDKSKSYIEQMKSQQLKDLDLNRSTSIKNNRNSARGINQMRAFNLATDVGINDKQEDIYNNFSNSMMSILSSEANMKNARDGQVMQGEQIRDDNDRKDRDSFYSQLATNIKDKGKGIQEMSYDLNKMKEGKVASNLVNQISSYGYYLDENGVKQMEKTAEQKLLAKINNKTATVKEIQLYEDYKKNKTE